MEHRKKAKTDYLPTDLTTETLLRLPEKSVARFSCVSKLWSSITTDPSFISLFETRSPRQRLLLCFQKYAKLFVSSIPQHTQNSNRSYSSSLSFDHHHITSSSSTESVHGLICFESEKPIVWNPSTRQFVTLPTIQKPCKSWKCTILFLGYDPIEGKHKIVCIPFRKTCYVCRVFTLGSVQESRRTVKINHKHRSSWDTVGRCIDGVIYYLTFPCQNLDYIVMSFDVRSEKFDMIKLPSGFDGNFLDAQKHKWSSQNFLSPFGDCDASMDTDLNLTETAGEDLNLKEWQVTNPSVMAAYVSIVSMLSRTTLIVKYLCNNLL
ncbi:LOW QUALITY PROTEIN: hypothetical protein HID58_085700, partial [Brassica napus]